MKKATIVCDMQFGSTGKGLIAGYLAERDQPDVVVTAWSANAGHTYINSEGRKWVHCMLANGIVSPKLKTVLIGGGSQMSIPVLLKEIDESLDLLQGKSILIHENACIIQDRHIEEENGPMTKIGSTKKGCGAAMIEKIRRNPESKIVAKDLLEGGIQDVLNGRELGFYGISRHYEEMGICLKVVSNAEYLKVLHAAERVQVEGAQGFSLGLHNGFYPYVTSRECTPAQICSDCNIPLAMVEKVVGTMRTYPIRVANRYDEQGNQIGWSGPAYEGQRELTWEEMGVTPEKTTVTKLTRRIFQFSEEQTRQAMQVVMPDEIFLNFANYCGDDDELAQIVDTIGRCGGTVRYYGWGPSSDDVEDTEESDPLLLDPAAYSDYQAQNPSFYQFNKSLNIA